MLENQDFIVVIENKTESSDHWNQLNDYDKWLNDNARGRLHKLVYLTYRKDDKPNQKPEGNMFCHLSYEETIIEWLKKIKSSYIPEETKLAVTHYGDFLEKLLDTKSEEARQGIKDWVDKVIADGKIANAKKIVTSNESRYLPDTLLCVYKELCRYYCEKLFEGIKSRNPIYPNKIIVWDFSLGGRCAPPFRCTYNFNEDTKIEFLPLAANGKNYGKLYVIKKGKLVYPDHLEDRQWNCNFFEWLNESTKDIVEKIQSEDGISIASCFSECMKT